MTRRNKRISNPITSQMVDIWDNMIMGIEDSSHRITRSRDCELGTMIDLLFNTSWSCYRLAVAIAQNFPQSEFGRFINDLTLEPTMTVIDLRGSVTDQTIEAINYITTLANELAQNENIDDLLDLAFMLHRLALIGRAILYDQLVIQPDLITARLQIGLSINEPVWNALDLKPTPVDSLIHYEIRDNLLLGDEVIRNWFPPSYYKRSSFWLPGGE
jgi:hypothetical protein